MKYSSFIKKNPVLFNNKNFTEAFGEVFGEDTADYKFTNLTDSQDNLVIQYKKKNEGAIHVYSSGSYIKFSLVYGKDPYAVTPLKFQHPKLPNSPKITARQYMLCLREIFDIHYYMMEENAINNRMYKSHDKYLALTEKLMGRK